MTVAEDEDVVHNPAVVLSVFILFKSSFKTLKNIQHLLPWYEVNEQRILSLNWSC